MYVATFTETVQNLHIHAVRANCHIMFTVQLYRYTGTGIPYLFIYIHRETTG
eukprot:COSAG05_NODE_12069_length_484_cov_325.498701_2_plen_51_part_01